MKIYETIIILNPNTSEEEVENIIESFKGSIEALKSEIVNLEKWGRRNLAFEVKKQRQGFFVLMHLRANNEAVDELARRCRITENVLRQQTICITEKQLDDHLRDKVRRSREAVEAAETGEEAHEVAQNTDASDADGSADDQKTEDERTESDTE